MTNRQAAIQIIRKLRREGFQALLAGGCVRDMLLSRRAKDYDVATDARPEEICDIFRRTLRVGAKFGVIIVLLDSQQVEVAAFRAESGYDDGRHPARVEFTSAREDALRRDFTINGMFFDPLKGELIDYVGGGRDLDKRIIRTIGPAHERFSEDYLRMLRAVRFAAQLDFKIAAKTFQAVKQNSQKIAKISGERIAAELDGLLSSPNRGYGVELLIKTGLAEAIFDCFRDKSQARFGRDVCGFLPEKSGFCMALAAIFSRLQTDEALKQCKILKLSRKQNNSVRFLLKNRSVLLNKDMPLADLKMIAAEPHFEDLYQLQKAIQKACGQKISALRVIRRRINSLAGKELRPKPLLDGNHLIALGTEPGPQVGKLGRELYTAQLSETVSTAGQAKKWVRKWLKNYTKLHKFAQNEKK